MKRRRLTPRLKTFFWHASLALGVLAVPVLIYLDALVTTEFDGHKWAIPAKVYARPLELYPGKPLRRDDFEWELRALGYRFEPGGSGAAQATADGYQVNTRGFHFADGVEPARQLRLSFDGQQLRSLQDGAGKKLSLVRLEPMMIGGIYPASKEDRILVRLDEVPPAVVASLLAVEDRDFEHHLGVSPKGILRALFNNLTGGPMQGGSTITQQLVKNFYLDERRTLGRKAVEAVMALLLELHYSKQQILETYLNEVYLGQQGNRAIHGFGLASQHYFSQPLRELELHQIALLVGAVKGASQYDPWRFPERALQRRNVVLDVLEAQGIASANDVAIAKAKPLDVADKAWSGSASYPAYLDLVRKQLARDYRPEDLTAEGLGIFTGFDPIAQRASERALAEVSNQLEQDKGLSPGTLEGAVVVLSVDTGEVAAVVGGRKARYAGYNRAVDAHRPIGSLAKPAVFLAALESGRYNLATPISDAPLSHKGGDGRLWQPRNYDKKNHGEPALFKALAESYNQSTARLGLQVGVGRVVDTMHKLGVARDIPKLPSVMLGAIDLSPLEVAGMYQSLASGGFRSPLRAIREVVDAQGKPLSRYGFQVEQVASPAAVYLLNAAMKEVVASGTAASIYKVVPRGFTVAGKTGTSDDQRDSWFAGYSGDLVAVVWLGRDDNQPTRFTGGAGAAQIWASLMAEAARQPFNPPRPAGIEMAWVDGNGRASGNGCAGARLMPFVAGTGPLAGGGCAGGATAPASAPGDAGRDLRDKIDNVLDWLRF